MSWIDWLEARLGFLGIPRLIQMIALLNGLVYVLHLLQPGYISLLTLQPALVMHGQLWRLVSYIFIPKIVFQNLSRQFNLCFSSSTSGSWSGSGTPSNKPGGRSDSPCIMYSA